MSNDLQEVKSSVKDLHTKVDNLTAISIENTADLKNHMRRTELNEDRIKMVEKWLLGILAALVIAALTKALKG